MDKELLHTMVIREILSWIATGKIEPGSRLPAERKLCGQFEVSRGTLRKAYSGLEKMGAIKIFAQSGAYAQKFSFNKIPKGILLAEMNSTAFSEIVVARKAIELAAIELACQRKTKSDMRILSKCIDGMEVNKDDLPEFLACDMKFHQQVVKSSKNPALMVAFKAISKFHKYSQVFSSSHSECEHEALRYHKQIFKEIENGNQKRCVQLLTRHLDNMIS